MKKTDIIGIERSRWENGQRKGLKIIKNKDRKIADHTPFSYGIKTNINKKKTIKRTVSLSKRSCFIRFTYGDPLLLLVRDSRVFPRLDCHRKFTIYNVKFGRTCP